jgi:hypothetical protein
VDTFPLTDDRIRLGPLAAWLAVSVIAIAVPTFRVPLSAASPANVESLSLASLLATQAVAACWVGPACGSWRTWAACGFAGVPLAMMAAFVAAVPPERVAAPLAVIAAWLGLLAWLGVRRPTLRTVWSAAAAMLTVGGGGLWYLAEEFGIGTRHPAWSACPVVATLAAVREPAVAYVPVAAALAAIAVDGVALAAFRRWRTGE